MASPFFQNYDDVSEQQLLEDLYVEAIDIHGIPCFYLPRRRYDVDGVLLEDTQHYFDRVVPIDLFLKNFDKFGGDRNLLSTFGIEVRDTIEVSLARRTWTERVGDLLDLERPNEGDLIYFAMNKRLFEVRYVERYSMLYPLGSLPAWEMRCELVEAVSARFDTGVAEIDAFESRTTMDLLRVSLQTADGLALRTANGLYWTVDEYEEDAIDPLDISQEVQEESDEFLDFSTVSPFTGERY